MAYRKFFRTLLDERPDADPGGVVVGPRSHHDLARFREHVVTPTTCATAMPQIIIPPKQFLSPGSGPRISDLFPGVDQTLYYRTMSMRPKNTYRTFTGSEMLQHSSQCILTLQKSTKCNLQTLRVCRGIYSCSFIFIADFTKF